MAIIDSCTSRIFSTIVDKDITREPAKQGVMAYQNPWFGFILSLLGYSVGYKVGDQTQYVNQNSLKHYIHRNLGYAKSSELKTLQLTAFLEKCVQGCADSHDAMRKALGKSVQTSRRLGAALNRDQVVGTEEALKTLLSKLAQFAITVSFEDLPKTDAGAVDVLQGGFFGSTISQEKQPLYHIETNELLIACAKTIATDEGRKATADCLNDVGTESDVLIRQFVARAVELSKMGELKLLAIQDDYAVVENGMIVGSRAHIKQLLKDMDIDEERLLILNATLGVPKVGSDDIGVIATTDLAEEIYQHLGDEDLDLILEGGEWPKGSPEEFLRQELLKIDLESNGKRIVDN